jgi:hypothetical protein
MTHALANVSAADCRLAVEAFDQLYGEMEDVLWCLSRLCREPLRDNRPAPVLEELVWTIKCWWAVRGVRREDKSRLARALVALDWDHSDFENDNVPLHEAEEYACSRVERLVRAGRTCGLARQEYAWCSKVLHWLSPWRVPIYSSFARKFVGVPTPSSHKDAYRVVAHRTLQVVRSVALSHSVLDARGSGSPLRAIDKCLWWMAGGATQRSAIAKDPWRVFDELGLDPGGF